jgi:hypothetical protein
MRISTLAVIMILALARPALAQPGSIEPVFLAEGRVGALWPQPPIVLDPGDLDDSDTRVAAGARVGFYVGGDPATRRLRVDLNFTYAPLGSAEFFDDLLLSFARFEGHWFEFTPAIAFDLVKTPRFFVDAHVGPSLIAETTTFLLERDPDDNEGRFENVCDLRAFEDLCDENFRGAVSAGAGARVVINPEWGLYLGVDYTWMSHDRHMLVATVGRRFR